MLIYHPVFDVNHSLYRVLLILESSTHDEFDLDLVRLMDFYTLFPHCLKDISPLPASLRSFKKVVNEITDPYELMPNTKRILFELEEIQNTALHNLIAKGLIDVDKFRNKKVVRTDCSIPEELYSSLKEDVLVDMEWFRFIVNEMPLIEFSGRNGLKYRTKMMEYKYDA